MNIVWAITLIAINSFVLITCIIAFKNRRINRSLNKAKKTRERGDKSKTMAYIDKALKIVPEDVYALTNKAVVLHDMGSYNEAIDYYHKALILARNSDMLATINYHLGILYCNMENYEESRKCFNNAMSDENVRNEEFWNNLGILQYKTNDKNAALRSFEKALSINPKATFIIENKKNLLAELD
ncbi:MAG: tetratricopeptide repeat protein [Prevotellaceae bacterium]|jgi:tetratricopeptide (TPR) repeat protein|nr:tetratricopeptide repeat protein [Prevotellaceae bacterium]